MLHKLGLTATLAASMAVLGCSHQDDQAAVQTSLPVAYGFHFLDEGKDAKLAYGRANSDDVALMFQCAKGSSLVEVSDVVRSAPAATLRLNAGGATSHVKVKVQPGPGVSIAVGQAPLVAPALKAFRKSGAVQVSYAGLTYAVSAKARERRSVERFFGACEARA
jgi:hypothetical protein